MTSEATPLRTDCLLSTPGGSAVGALGLRGIDHVGWAVADLDQAIAFHERVFGMSCVHIEENAEQDVREAIMAVGPDASAGRLQLLAPLSPSSTMARFLDRSGPGIQHIAYAVEDIDAACAELRSRDVRTLHLTTKRGTAGSRINFLHPKDTGGVLIELVEPVLPMP